MTFHFYGIPKWFGYKTIDPVSYYETCVIIQRKLTFSKTYCLGTPFQNKCSECDIKQHISHFFELNVGRVQKGL